jgi:hypothetical protein
VIVYVPVVCFPRVITPLLSIIQWSVATCNVSIVVFTKIPFSLSLVITLPTVFTIDDDGLNESFTASKLLVTTTAATAMSQLLKHLIQ